MINRHLTRKYMKELIDTMERLHLNSVAINGRIKFQITDNRYIMYDMDYNYNEPLETISGETKNEFYYALKESGFYKMEII